MGSTLQAIIEAYLISKGWEKREEKSKLRRWTPPKGGVGVSFDEAISNCIFSEKIRSKRKETRVKSPPSPMVTVDSQPNISGMYQ